MPCVHSFDSIGKWDIVLIGMIRTDQGGEFGDSNDRKCVWRSREAARREGEIAEPHADENAYLRDRLPVRGLRALLNDVALNLIEFILRRFSSLPLTKKVLGRASTRSEKARSDMNQRSAESTKDLSSNKTIISWTLSRKT